MSTNPAARTGACVTHTSARSRLEDLERHYQPLACATCWWWTETPILVDDDGRYSRPLACPDCDRQHLAPYAIHLIGIPVDLP
jgi:hypothetical protein